MCQSSLRTNLDWADTGNIDNPIVLAFIEKYGHRPRLLDLFSGAGGATRGLQQAGFHVTGVDINPQPHYCGNEFHQADAMEYPLEGFDAYWASPPCQYYSRLRHLPWLKDRIYWRSVPPVIELLQPVIKPWVIENVEDCWDMPDSFVICGSSIGLTLYRHRRFLTNFPVMLYSHQKHTQVITPGRASLSKRHHGNQGFKKISRDSVAGHFAGVELARKVMGISWMNQAELAQAIPPAYSEYIGTQMLKTMGERFAKVLEEE